jgi:voltage-gated potassium channel
MPSPREPAAPRGPDPARLVIGQLGPAIALSAGLVAVSTVGYVVIADYSWFDALYMTIITLGTIGYQEVQPLDTDGRVWTIVVVAAGFFLLVYVASRLTSLFVSGDLPRAIAEKRGAAMRAALDGHVIVVGFGRVGQATALSVIQQGRRCIVVDLDADRAPAIAATDAVALIGDGRDEHVLTEAGIDRATALVAAAHDDATNLVVVLTARSLRPDLRIVARVNDAQWHARMTRAGADACTSPYESVGALLATSAVRSDVIGLQDLPTLGLRTEEIAVHESSPAVGRSPHDIASEHPDVLLLGLHSGGNHRRWREVHGDLQPGDVVVAMAAPDALQRLNRQLGGPAGSG